MQQQNAYDKDDDDGLSRSSSNEQFYNNNDAQCSSQRKRKLVENDTNEQWNLHFINAVRSEECLWKKDHVHYKNNVQRNYAWRKIAAEVKQTVEVCKERWQELRLKSPYGYEDGDEFASNESYQINKFESLTNFLEQNLYRPRPKKYESDHYDCEVEDWIPKLIRAVREEELLWKVDNIYYMNKEKRHLAWLQISEQVKQPAYVCKNRWKTLREQFVRRMHKNKLFVDERFALIADKMMFIKSQIKLRRKRYTQPILTINDSESNTSINTSEPQQQPPIIPQEPTLRVIYKNKIVPQTYTLASACKPILSVKKVVDPLHFDVAKPMQIKDVRSLNENNLRDDSSPIDCINDMAKIQDLCEEFQKIIKNLHTIANKIPNADEEFLRASLTLMQDLPADAKTRIKNSLLEVILNERKHANKLKIN